MKLQKKLQMAKNCRFCNSPFYEKVQGEGIGDRITDHCLVTGKFCRAGGSHCRLNAY